MELTKLPIDELMNIEITTASKIKENQFDTPYAVYVITGEDIRRSGVRSIPEALRLAPGVEVAQVDASRWAVSIRGSNDRFSNFLLVLIDGRSVYDLLFAGVRWEEIDLLLEDIDRIEIIRGPGGALWGANAVNGVINIITKHSRDTQGLYVKSGGGNEEKGFVDLRYGGSLNEDLTYRLYGTFFNRDDFADINGNYGAGDNRRMYHGGFRTDWNISDNDKVTLQGDIFKLKFDATTRNISVVPPHVQGIQDESDYKGGNILTRWSHYFSNGSGFKLQTYYDYTDRYTFFIDEKRHTIDLDLQYDLPSINNHQIITGLGFRIVSDDIVPNTGYFFYRDNSRTDPIYSAFIQDRISLFDDKFDFILGMKFEHNDYSGFEIQPTARFIYKPNNKHRIWGAVSRAVKPPARSGDGLFLDVNVIPESDAGIPALIRLTGNPDLKTIDLLALELGHRYKPADWIFMESTAYIYFYDNMITEEPGDPIMVDDPVPHLLVPLVFENNSDAKAYGVEFNVYTQPARFWTLKFNYTFFKFDTDIDSGHENAIILREEGKSPQNQVKIQSLLDLPGHLELDTSMFYVDELDFYDIPDYFRFDIRLGWRPTDNIEISLAGQNIFDDVHQEFGNSFFVLPSKVERSFYGAITFRH